MIAGASISKSEQVNNILTVFPRVCVCVYTSPRSALGSNVRDDRRVFSLIVLLLCPWHTDVNEPSRSFTEVLQTRVSISCLLTTFKRPFI